MADCVSNAAEMVKQLRSASELGDAPTFDKFGVIVSKSTAQQAADAIETLLAENAKLKERCELLQGNNVLLRGCVDKYNIEQIERLREENAKLKAERDAAVADLKYSRVCFTCKHISDPDCDGCHVNLDRWEWRGAQKEEEDG